MNNGLILDGLQMSTITKVTEKRVSELTMKELKIVLSSIDYEEAKLLIMAIRSGDAGRIQAAIEMPVFRVMQKLVTEEVNRRESV